MANRKTARIDSKAHEDPDTVSGEPLEEHVEKLSRDLASALVHLKREKAKRNEALREGQEVFHQFFDQNEEALLVLQPETCGIIDANPAAAGLFGYAREDLVERGPSLFVDPDELHNLRQIISRKEVSEERRILTYRKKDGNKGMLAFRVKVIRLRERDVVFASFRDITDEVRSKAETRFRQAQLIYTNKMASLGLLMANIASEINSPNNSIMYNAQLFSDAWRDVLPVLERHYRDSGDFPLGGPFMPFSEMREVVPRLLSEIAAGAAKIKKIVDNLDEFARSDDARLDREVDVNRIIRHAVSVLGDQVHRYAERIHLELREDIPAIRGNSQKLEQVFINLVMNALHALPNKSCSVRISAQFRRDRNMVEIKVSDEGAGMSKEVLDRITEPFFSTKLGSGGTGLGLYISHSIVKEHRGTMEFESAPGTGTTVTVSLPPAQAAVSPESRSRA
jgi:hypothetical protein